MAKRPQIVSIEFDLRQKGPAVDAWVTVYWGVDDEMQVCIGKRDPRSFDRSSLHKQAEAALRKISRDLAKTSVKPL